MAEKMDTQEEQFTKNGKRKRKGAAVLFVCILAAALVYGYWWLFMRNRVTTDDAYVMADSAVVSSRVPGTIGRVLIENDDQVAAGDVMVELDPRDYQAEVDRSRAALEQTAAQIHVAEVNVQLTESQTSAQLQAAEAAVQAAQQKEQELRHNIGGLQENRVAAEAELSNAQRESDRYATLYKQGAGSEQQRDRTNTAYKKAKAQTGAVEAQISAAQAAVSAAAQEIDRAKAQRDVAKANLLRVDVEKNNLAALKAKYAETQAQLQIAEYNLSYCTIKAPLSGYIAQKRIQVGDCVQPGQALFAVIPLHGVYVEANYKETQLDNVRLGQPVEIKSDLYPDHIYQGKVVGIRAGTGAAFSLLPPENATGNWIKVVQRIPVRIVLDKPPSDEFPLRVGASLEVTISTVDKSGPMLRMVKSGQARAENSQ